MFQTFRKGLSKTQVQLIVHGFYLLVGILLIVVGVECLDAERIALRHYQPAPPTACAVH